MCIDMEPSLSAHHTKGDVSSCAPHLLRSPSGAALAETFRELRAAFQGKGEDSKRLPYNVILTDKFMMVVPRSQESWGPVSVNSMGFAGSLFVRSQEELDYIKEKGAMTVLSHVGLPWS